MSIVLSGAARVRAAAIIVGLLGSTGAALAESKPIVVNPDRALIVKVPQGVQTMIIGNPFVADVTMLKGNASMIITGRSFGTTNMISLDSAGNTVGETLIKVTQSPQSMIVLRGGKLESYSCNPRCAPTMALGDDMNFMTQSIGSVKARNAAALNGGK